MIEVKADALEASFDAVEMTGASERPMLMGAREPGGAAFEGFLRSGMSVEMKSFVGTSGDAGGYAVPREIDQMIDATLKSISPIRAIANVVSVGTAGYRKLVTTGGTPSGWAAETGSRAETATPVFVEIAPPMGELYANPPASQAMLDDAQFDVEQWLAGETAMEFAKAEGAAFVNGSGTNRPKGFLQAATSTATDATRTFGQLQYLASGAAGDFGSNPQDRLIDLVQSLRGPYRQGASFVMNSSTLARIRKFKTSDGQFLWAPSLAAGQPATLLGYPVVEAEDIRRAFHRRDQCRRSAGGAVGWRARDAVRCRHSRRLCAAGWHRRYHRTAHRRGGAGTRGCARAGGCAAVRNRPGAVPPRDRGDGRHHPRRCDAPVCGRAPRPGTLAHYCALARTGEPLVATLILSTVGKVFGPIGAAIGAVAGQAIDNALFKPKGRQGPRLTELAVQTSSYGTPLPKIFGTMRIAGCVIWSTDLIESRSTSHSGKGQPSTTSYSYAASFAVALSGRAILGVGRIWADGKLLRGAAGDFKTMTGFRLHLGSEEQMTDPVIAAAEGGMAPAHRGIAYAVFENFQLGDYGNRLPSLTFEVIGDAAPPGIGEIAAALGEGAITSDATLPMLEGFSAYGDSIRGVVETLAVAAGARFMPQGRQLLMTAAITPIATLNDDGYALAGGRGERGLGTLATIERVPKTISVAHYDPARDFQTGLQRARRPGAGHRDERIDMPAALSADAAKTLAEASLSRAESARAMRTLKLGWANLGTPPGSCVTIAGAPARGG